MTKLVIFDLDGTLLNTIEDIANSTNFALKQFDFPEHPLKAYNQFIGNGVNKLLERALPADKRHPDIVSMLKPEFVKHYATHGEECTKPYDGISDLINKISSEGYQLAVASNKMHMATTKLVKQFFPNIQFFEVLGQREGFPVKPNPAILDEIIEKAGLEKSEVLYVGDSGVDAATAYNAKVPFAGVLWGFRPKDELQAAGADVFAETPSKLLEIIHNNQ